LRREELLFLGRQVGRGCPWTGRFGPVHGRPQGGWCCDAAGMECRLTRLRRRRCMMCYWHDGAFVAHGFPRLSPTTLHPVAAEILWAFEDGTEPSKVVENLEGFDRESVEQAVAVLRRDRLLLEEGGVEADEDERIARHWGPWAPEASLFHYCTQDEPYTR